MVFELEWLKVPPAGFGRCPRCTYLNNDSAEICFACASQEMNALAPPDKRCRVCDQILTEDDCGNPVCAMSRTNRAFGWNASVAMRSGVIERAMMAYKYNAAKGWRHIFARILVGFLENRKELFAPFDLIIPMPAHPATRGWDHAAAVLESAEQLTTRWPFYLRDPQLVVRTEATPAMSQLHTYRERKANAEGAIRQSLMVTNPLMATKKKILIYDDVFTDGLTLREVARCLKGAGAAMVCGVTLARQPFKGQLKPVERSATGT